MAQVRELDLDAYEPAVRLRALERLETSRRHQAVASHDLIASLAKEEFAAIGGAPHKVIADWLRISCAEARRRIHNAEQLAPDSRSLEKSCRPNCRPPPRRGARECSMSSICGSFRDLCATCRRSLRRPPSSMPSGCWRGRPPSFAPTS
ncbi:hypothetical protein I553_1336 [Mycobacterium xenopi 4042]|uniref:DUF222 domain-containing protein n=1 Tax=Mycobacterium xenopi 4042 TaxID=1299334 RepID=X8CFT6_MYCXE|nr:hypothetical protein I553_1336 [Mycobacterium xenopi 4042]